MVMSAVTVMSSVGRVAGAMVMRSLRVLRHASSIPY